MFSPFARRQWMLGLIVGAMACEGPNVTSSTAASATRRSADVVPNAPPAGGLLTFDVPDPKGDATGPIDVRDMNFVLDNTSGAFSVTLQADPTAPFATGGTIDININLYNPAKSSFFHCNPVEFTLNAATQTIVLIGSSSELMTWEAGDQVYTNSLKGTPNPPNVTVYRSQVIWDFDVTATTEQEDVLAYSNLAKPAKLARSKTAALALQGLTCS